MRRAKRWRRAVTDPVVCLGVWALVHTAGALGPSLRRRLARTAGSLLWRAGCQWRQTALENLGLAFPEVSGAERCRIGRQALCHTVWNALDFAHLLHAPQAVLRAVALDPVLEQMRDGTTPRRVMMVMPHLGSWELLGQVASLQGIPTAAVAHELRNPYVNRLVQRARAAHGLQVILSEGAVRGVVRAVRAGRHIGILMDQNTRLKEGGAYVDFFGLPVTVTRAPAVLSRRLGMEVHVGACVRQDSGFRVTTEGLSQMPEAYPDEHSLLQAIMAANERLIRRFPEQYVWTYRRWRYIPPDLPEALQRRYPSYARPGEPCGPD
jgi:KDO2-lipid IV(A) lauroyltransferase